MRFTSDEVERLLSVARDVSLGTTFVGRMDAVTDSLSSLIPNTALSAIVLDLGRRAETPPEQIYYKNGVREHLVAYTAHYIQQDPMLPAIPLADGRAHLLSDFVPDAKFGGDAFTSDFLKLLNVRHVMGLSRRMPTGALLSLAVQRERGLPDFSAKEREILRLAAPHIARGAFEALLRERVAQLSTADPAIAGGLVFTPRGEIVHADAIGASLAGAFDQGAAKAQGSLGELVSRFSAGNHADAATLTFTTRLGDGRWIRLTLSSLQEGRGSTVLALLEVLLPGSQELMACVMERAGLSQREREVARLVLEGLGNREIAARTGLGLGTVNIYLSRCYQKLCVRDRHELTTSLLTGRSRSELG